MSIIDETAVFQEITYRLSDDRNLVQLEKVHRFLNEEAYWSKGITLETFTKSVQHSICFSVFCGEDQVGFARVISDQSTIAYLGDVFILPAHRGKGLSKWLMKAVMFHPELQKLRRWILLTSDAHELYRNYGFTGIKSPEKWMELHDPHVYSK